MAVTISAKDLAAALRLGDSAEELAQVTRLLSFATLAVGKHAPDAPEAVQNESVIRIAGYLYDAPTAARGVGFAAVLRNSGAAGMLLPYRVHRAGEHVGGWGWHFCSWRCSWGWALMPLDRLITVRLEALGKRVEGKYVDGPITVLRVWAERISSASTDAASAGTGTVVQAIVTWRVRWVTAIARHRVDLMSIEADVFPGTWKAWPRVTNGGGSLNCERSRET